MKDRFVFDSEKKSVDWNLLLHLHKAAGQDSSSFVELEGEFFSGAGSSIYPRAIVPAVLFLDRDEAVYQITSNAPGKVRVLLTSSAGTRGWSVEGVGASQYKAMLDASIKVFFYGQKKRRVLVNALLVCFQALLPGSSLLSYVNRRYNDEQKKAVAKILTSLRVKASEMTAALLGLDLHTENKKDLTFSFAFCTGKGLIEPSVVIDVGYLDGFEVDKEESAPRHIPEKQDVYNRYLEVKRLGKHFVFF